MEKFDSPVVEVWLECQLLFDGVVDVPVPLQFMPELCVEVDGVRLGDDSMLFIPIPMDGCCENELPMPGWLGAMAGNDEFREVRVLSGVIVLLAP